MFVTFPNIENRQSWANTTPREFFFWKNFELLDCGDLKTVSPVDGFVFINFRCIEITSSGLCQECKKEKLKKKKKELGVTDCFRVKRVENYPDFETLVHVIQHGLQGFIVKNIRGESTEAKHFLAVDLLSTFSLYDTKSCIMLCSS